MAPSAPRGLEAALSSFAAPSTGNRNKSKTSHIRVVARIRPMNENETKSGCVSAIHPLPSSAFSSSRRIFGMSPKRPERCASPPPRRGGPLSFLTPDRNKKKRSESTPTTAAIMKQTSTFTTATIMEQTPIIRNAKTPNKHKDGNNEYGTAQSLTAQQKQFDFDAVFAPTATQREVYDRSVGDAVRRNIFRGYNTTILAYGMTASGKTYTMSGRRDAEMAAALAEVSPSAGRDSTRKAVKPGAVEGGSSPIKDSTVFTVDEDAGIIPRAVHDLFKAKQRHESAGEVTIHLTYLEIYNDELRDLLVDADESEKSLKLRDQGDDGVVVSGLSSVKVSSGAQVKKLMDEAASRRMTASTRMNMRSSRSHAICTLQVTINPAINSKASAGSTLAEVISAKLTLVDLAGSERIKQTGVVGVQQQESININKDLFVLAKVISALAEKGKKNKTAKVHVPYRDSKLTRLLRDSLGGNCCTVMVACISPADSSLEESVNTLRYAERTKSICNSIKQNVEKAMMTPAECAAMRGENKMLRAKVLELKRQVQQLGKGCEEEDLISTSSSPSFDTLSLTDSVDSLRHKNSMLEYLDSEIVRRKCLVKDLRNEANYLKGSINSSLQMSATESVGENDLAEVASLSEKVSTFKESLMKIESEAKKRKQHLRKEISKLESELKSLQNERSRMTRLPTEPKTSAAGIPLPKLSKSETPQNIEMVPMTNHDKESEVQDTERSGEASNETITEIDHLQHELSATRLQLELQGNLSFELEEEKKLRAECEKNLAKTKIDLLDTLQDRDDLRVAIAVHEDSIEKLQKDLHFARQRIQAVEAEKLELEGKLDEKENHDKMTCPANEKEVIESKGVLSVCNRQTEPTESVVDGVRTDSSNQQSMTKEVSTEAADTKNASLDDSTTLTDGEITIESDHQAIRAHAAKMLFWANQAISKRRGPGSICSSIASSNGSEFLPTMRALSSPTYKANPTGGKPPLPSAKESRTKTPKREKPPMVISNIGDMNDLEGQCNCHSSLFSGNANHVDFYLPKLGMACSCGKQQSELPLAEKGDDPLALHNILRPWQVEFLKSINICTADVLVLAYHEKGDELAKAMRKWRKQKRLASVKTRSCGVALHIWARTCKSIVRSVRAQQAEGVKVVKKPAFLEVSIPSDNRTVSTLGCGSVTGGTEFEM